MLISFLFLFQELLFGLTRNLPALKLSFVRFPTRLSPYKYCVVDLGKLTELLALVLLHRYCKSFNVLSSGLWAVQRPFPDSPAKLRRFFFPAKFSGEKIFRTLNLPATPPVIACGASVPPPGLRPDTRRRPFHSRKRVQNYNFPPYPPNFLRTFFRKNFTTSPPL